MNWLKTLAGGLYAMYLLLIFVTFMFIFLLPIWIISFSPFNTRTRRFVKIARLWSRILLWLTGCPHRTTGRDHFAPGQAYIIVANHHSFMDIPATYIGIPGTAKSLAKKEVASTPIFGFMYRIGSVIVDRKDPASRKQSFAEMREVLDNGIHMLLYPEGTRNKTGQPLKEFYDGAFSLAIETGKPILPAVIFNTGKILPFNRPFFAWPSPIRVDFLPPVSPDGYSMTELKEKVYKTMWDHIVKGLH